MKIYERAFAPETGAVGAARQVVADLMEEVGGDPTRAALLTSELATNAIEHARSSFRVVVTVDDALVRVEVHDQEAPTAALLELVARASVMVATCSVVGD